MIIWRRMVVPKYGMYREFEIHTMIETEDYIPIATADELNALRNATAQTFGAGSKWEGTYTGGLDKKYVLIDDIDLDVSPYNEGEGWAVIGTTGSPLVGVLDGAGRFVTGLFINKPGQGNQCLLGYCDDGEIKNLFVSGNVTGANRTSLIAANNFSAPAFVMSQCAGAGRVTISGSGTMIGGGVIGFSYGDCLFTDLFGSVSIMATDGNDNRVGGLVSNIREAGQIKNSFSLGIVIAIGDSAGLVRSGSSENVAASYYNTTTTGQSDTGQGMRQTTAQLLGMGAKGPEWEAGTYYLGDTVHIGDIVYRCNVASTTQEPPHADWTVTDAWDTATWEFKADRYPIQRIFGEQAVHRAPPKDVVATPDGDDIVLTWDDAATEVDLPDGYFVYQSIDNGPWTKLNATAVADKTYTVTGPLDAGEYNYFITAYYDLDAYKIKETGNSATTTETIA